MPPEWRRPQQVWCFFSADAAGVRGGSTAQAWRESCFRTDGCGTTYVNRTRTIEGSSQCDRSDQAPAASSPPRRRRRPDTASGHRGTRRNMSHPIRQLSQPPSRHVVIRAPALKDLLQHGVANEPVAASYRRHRAGCRSPCHSPARPMRRERTACGGQLIRLWQALLLNPGASPRTAAPAHRPRQPQ